MYKEDTTDYYEIGYLLMKGMPTSTSGNTNFYRKNYPTNEFD